MTVPEYNNCTVEVSVDWEVVKVPVGIVTMHVPYGADEVNVVQLPTVELILILTLAPEAEHNILCEESLIVYKIVATLSSTYNTCDLTICLILVAFELLYVNDGVAIAYLPIDSDKAPLLAEVAVVIAVKLLKY
jgi:hypothetical protein